MHKLIRVLSSRLFLVIALVIAQIYFLLAYICQFSYVNNLTPLFTLIGLLLAVWQVNRKTDPAYKIAWVIVLLAVPVIGVPMPTTALGGRDSLSSIVQMPSGIPVATVAIGGGKNAGILAAKILAVSDPALLEKLKAYSERMKEEVEAKDARLQETGCRNYTK